MLLKAEENVLFLFVAIDIFTCYVKLNRAPNLSFTSKYELIAFSLLDFQPNLLYQNYRSNDHDVSNSFKKLGHMENLKQIRTLNLNQFLYQVQTQARISEYHNSLFIY